MEFEDSINITYGIWIAFFLILEVVYINGVTHSKRKTEEFEIL